MRTATEGPLALEDMLHSPTSPAASSLPGTPRGSRCSGSGTEGGPPSPDPPDPPPAVEPAIAERRLQRSYAALGLTGTTWGPFRISPKSQGVFGGFQAACCYHRLNNKSGCKKWFPLSSNAPEHKRQVARRIMWWLIRHSDFQRQRDHIRLNIEDEDVPSDDFLVAVLPSAEDRPALSTIKTDEELDLEDGIEALGRGGRGARGRGRGRGLAAASANEESHDGSSAGSTDNPKGSSSGSDGSSSADGSSSSD